MLSMINLNLLWTKKKTNRAMLSSACGLSTDKQNLKIRFWSKARWILLFYKNCCIEEKVFLFRFQLILYSDQIGRFNLTYHAAQEGKKSKLIEKKVWR